jgi:hypothetical protein
LNDDCCDLRGLLTGGLDANAQHLVTRAFAALWQGTAPVPADIAGDTDPLEAAEVFRRLATAGRCELDSRGRVVGAHGITQTLTRHRVIHAGRRHQTWCAFDAVGIPSALGIDATAETACPHCDTPIAIPIAGGVPGDDGTMVIWLPADTGSHLITDFCSQSNVFCSAPHVDAWLAGRSRNGQTVTLADAAEIGRETWADVAEVAEPGEARR